MGAPQQGVTQPPCKGEAPERRLKTQRITRYKPVLTCYGPGIFVRLPALIRFSGGSLATKRAAKPAGPRTWGTGSAEMAAGNWELETSWKLEAGSWKLETGNWKLETGNCV